MHLRTEFDNRHRERNAYTKVWKSFNSVLKQTSIKKLGQGNVHKRQKKTLMGFRINFDKSVDKDMHIKSDKDL